MKYFALALTAIFLLFTYWQFNDPDPVWWSVLYLVPAYISYRVSRHHYNIELLAVLIVLYIAGALNLWMQMGRYEGFFTPGAALEMKTENQELVREASGMAISAIVFLYYAIYAAYRIRRHNEKVVFEVTGQQV